jgi:cytochrome c peroxidase
MAPHFIDPGREKGVRMYRCIILLLSVMVFVAGVAAWSDELEPIEQLGKLIFFDENLATPPKQSCATCHWPEAGFTSSDPELNEELGIYHGAVEPRFGNRKIPTSAYAGDTPPLHFDEEEGLWVGGLFWDGRATGWVLGDPLAEQAMGPFLNPVEQNLAGARQLVRLVQRSTYAPLFRAVWGEDSLDSVKNVEASFEMIAHSLAAYQRSPEVNSFSSKYDYFLRGEAELSTLESDGLTLFEGKAMCSSCHPSQPGPDGEKPLFTDYTYDNLGLPKNPHNPFYTQPKKINPDGKDWIDPGLGGFLMSIGHSPEVYEPELGKHRVPTLRNVDKRPYPAFVKAYGHNGVFKSLEEIVHFYNTRDVKYWPPPEVPINVNEDELGNLALTPHEEEAIVAFLKTLSDGYVPD